MFPSYFPIRLPPTEPVRKKKRRKIWPNINLLHWQNLLPPIRKRFESNSDWIISPILKNHCVHYPPKTHSPIPSHSLAVVAGENLRCKIIYANFDFDPIPATSRMTLFPIYVNYHSENFACRRYLRMKSISHEIQLNEKPGSDRIIAFKYLPASDGNVAVLINY